MKVPGVRFIRAQDFQTAVYPSRMAPIGAKLWENAFQTIPDISFFDAENNKKKIVEL